MTTSARPTVADIGVGKVCANLAIIDDSPIFIFIVLIVIAVRLIFTATTHQLGGWRVYGGPAAIPPAHLSIPTAVAAYQFTGSTCSISLGRQLLSKNDGRGL